MQLAQINIATLLHPKGDPRVQEFFDNLDRINAIAERMPGFVWRLKDESGSAVDVPYSDDPLTIANLTVWESVEALQRYVFQTAHKAIYARRASWFAAAEGPTFALWWVPEGVRPTFADGAAKLAQLRRDGPSASDAPDGVFGWNETTAAAAWRAARCA